MMPMIIGAAGGAAVVGGIIGVWCYCKKKKGGKGAAVAPEAEPARSRTAVSPRGPARAV